MIFTLKDSGLSPHRHKTKVNFINKSVYNARLLPISELNVYIK